MLKAQNAETEYRWAEDRVADCRRWRLNWYVRSASPWRVAIQLPPWQETMAFGGCLGARLREVPSSLREAKRFTVVCDLVRIYLQKRNTQRTAGHCLVGFEPKGTL
jgi:hypothetical protein